MNSSESNTTGRSMYKHVITLLHIRPHDQRTITRWRSYKQSRRLLERPALRHGEKRVLDGAELCCESALRCAKDAGSRRELGVGVVARGGDDGSCEFGAGDPVVFLLKLVVSDKGKDFEGRTREKLR